MKPVVSLLISMQLCMVAHSQPDSQVRKGPPPIPREYTAVKIALPNLVDLINPNLAVAVERRFNPKNAVQMLVGITLPLNRSAEGMTVTAKGIKLRAEYRRYHRRKPNNKDWFYAAELFYTGYRSGSYGWYEDTTRITENHYYDEFILSKKMGGAAFRIGFQIRFKKHFLFEFSGGIGFKYRHVTQTGRINPEDMTTANHPNVLDISNATGSETMPVFPCNFMLGYVFY